MNDQPANVQEALVPPPAPSAPLPDDLMSTMRLPALEIATLSPEVPSPEAPSPQTVSPQTEVIPALVRPLPAGAREPMPTLVPARKRLRLVASRLARVARGVVATAARVRIAPPRWTVTRAHVGIACGLSGAALVVTSIVLGWSSVSAQGIDRYGSAAGAVVVARAAIAIATMITGASLVRMGERLAFVGPMLGAAPPRPRIVPRAVAPR